MKKQGIRVDYVIFDPFVTVSLFIIKPSMVGLIQEKYKMADNSLYIKMP